MRLPGRGEKRRTSRDLVAAAEASHIADEAALLLDRAAGVEWYEGPGSDVDFAALHALPPAACRRARAGEKGGPSHGDEAVRAAPRQADPEALVWFASRAISFMDENGFPECGRALVRRDRRDLTFCSGRLPEQVGAVSGRSGPGVLPRTRGREYPRRQP